MWQQTLMLTPWMAPHRVIPWQRAVVLAFLGKVEVVDTYDEVVRSRTLAIKAPAVVRLVKWSTAQRQKVRFSRLNVFVRDGFRCQYCGTRKFMRELNYDHVVPRVRGGRTTWENIVTACYGCNDKKGSRTPEEAGLRLLRKPQKPSFLPLAPVAVGAGRVPSVWRHYLPVQNV